MLKRTERSQWRSAGWFPDSCRLPKICCRRGLVLRYMKRNIGGVRSSFIILFSRQRKLQSVGTEEAWIMRLLLLPKIYGNIHGGSYFSRGPSSLIFDCLQKLEQKCLMIVTAARREGYEYKFQLSYFLFCYIIKA